MVESGEPEGRSVSRVLSLDVAEAIKGSGYSAKLPDVVRATGLHRETVDRLLKDNASTINRHALERLCDYYGLTLADVLKFEPTPFWTELTERRTLILCSESSNDRVILGIETLRQQFKDRFDLETETHFSNDPEEIVQLACDNNCVVVASPVVNDATEILVAKHFDAEPFNPEPANRRKIPFRIVLASGHRLAQKADESAILSRRDETFVKPGIYHNRKKLDLGCHLNRSMQHKR